MEDITGPFPHSHLLLTKPRFFSVMKGFVDSGEAGPLPSPGVKPGVNSDESKPIAIISFLLPVIDSGKEV